MKNAFVKLMIGLLAAMLMMGMCTAAFAENESIHISLVNEGDIYYGDLVTLWASVSNVTDGYTIVWEMETADGWVQVGSGQSYSFTVTEANAAAAYRALLVIAE